MMKGPDKIENQTFVMNIELMAYSFIASIILSFENGFFLFSIPVPFMSFFSFSDKNRRWHIFAAYVISVFVAIPASLFAGPYFEQYRQIMTPYNYTFLLISLILVVMQFPFTFSAIMRESDVLSDEIKYKSEHDPLTGVHNRESFDQYLKALEIRADISGCIIMFDIDNFKKINDSFGHDVGDIALKVISGVAQSLIRESDILVRWGGEEFVIMIEDMRIEPAVEKAEEIRRAIENTPYHEGKHLTVSLGVSEIMKGDSVDKAIKRADDNLYKSKTSGKNRVTAG